MSIESDRLLSQLAAALNLVDESGHPNCSALGMMLRDLPALRWNSKVFGRELADKYYGDVRASRKARRTDPFELMWRATKFTDFEQAWEVERLATAIRLAARESRWVRMKNTSIKSGKQLVRNR